jgi:hypothetical protein
MNILKINMGSLLVCGLLASGAIAFAMAYTEPPKPKPSYLTGSLPPKVTDSALNALPKAVRCDKDGAPTDRGISIPRYCSVEKQRELEAIAADYSVEPVKKMYNTYRLYAYVKFCHDSREGYAVVNISDREMELAHRAVKTIQQSTGLSSADLDVLWQRAIRDNSGSYGARVPCQNMQTALVGKAGISNYDTRRP